MIDFCHCFLPTSMPPIFTSRATSLRIFDNRDNKSKIILIIISAICINSKYTQNLSNLQVKKKKTKNFVHVKEVSKVKYHAATCLFTENGRVELGTHNKPIT